MAWFRKRKKRTYVVYYQVDDYVRNPKRRFIVKASDIAKAVKLCQEKETHPISILDWEILDGE